MGSSPSFTVEQLDARVQAASRARSWFVDPDRRRVSSEHDDRETVGSRELVVALCLQRLGREPRRILDVGCGAGELLESFARCVPDADLIGVDPAGEAVLAARERLASARAALVLHAGVEDLVVEPAVAIGSGLAVGAAVARRGIASDPETVVAGQVDLVVIHLCLALWQDPFGGLVTALETLAPGGLLYAVDLVRPESVAAVNDYLWLATHDDEREYLADQLIASFTVDELRVGAAGAVAEAIEALAGRGVVAGFEVEAGRGGLGGFAMGSIDARRLWADGDVRTVIQSLGEFSDAERRKADQVVHLWIRRVR